MRLGNPLVALAAVGDDYAEARPGEVETVDALASDGDFCEDFFSSCNGDFGIVIKVDEPFWVLKHQHVVV